MECHNIRCRKRPCILAGRVLTRRWEDLNLRSPYGNFTLAGWCNRPLCHISIFQVLTTWKFLYYIGQEYPSQHNGGTGGFEPPVRIAIKYETLTTTRTFTHRECIQPLCHVPHIPSFSNLKILLLGQEYSAQYYVRMEGFEPPVRVVIKGTSFNYYSDFA